MMIREYITSLTDEERLPVLVCCKEFTYENSEIIDTEDVYNVMKDLYDMDKLAEEYIYMMSIDGSGRLRSLFEISHGTVNSAQVQPREVIQKFLMSGGVSMILTHNHPSGRSKGSAEDLIITKRMQEACELMGIRFLDHIVIGDNEYYSFRDRGFLEENNEAVRND